MEQVSLAADLWLIVALFVTLLSKLMIGASCYPSGRETASWAGLEVGTRAIALTFVAGADVEASILYTNGQRLPSWAWPRSLCRSSTPQ